MVSRRITHGLVAALVGVPSAVIGLGGAELRLPYLVGVAGLDPRRAIPVNLAISLATLLAALPARLVAADGGALLAHADLAAAMAGGAIVAAFLGADWLGRMSRRLLERLILGLLVALGALLIAETAIALAPGGVLADPAALRLLAAAALGFGIGLVGSLLGVAGGELIIPTLVLGYAIGIKDAGSLSLLISLPAVAVGCRRHWRRGAFAAPGSGTGLLAPMMLGAVAGAAIGGLLIGLVPAGALKLALGALLIWSAWKVFRAVRPRAADYGTAIG